MLRAAVPRLTPGGAQAASESRPPCPKPRTPCRSRRDNGAMQASSIAKSGAPASAAWHALVEASVAIDLEVGVDDARIHALAAVRGSDGRAFVARGAAQATLDRLDRFADGAQWLVGHNLVAFDRPHLAAVQPGLRLLALPSIDTLRLNPLAFPRNPYHQLVKHYKDGGLRRGQRNDPELDARSTLQLLDDQLNALGAAGRQEPDLVAAWHGMLGGDAGADAVFGAARASSRPAAAATAGAIARSLAGRGCRSAAQSLIDLISEESQQPADVARRMEAR
jgi:ATP-dependent DNA helicase RecQ